MKKTRVEDVSIHDLAISYSTQLHLKCTFVHSDGWKITWSRIRVRGMQTTKKAGEHLIIADCKYDLNRPGQDAGDDMVWGTFRFRYNEHVQVGVAYLPRHRKK